MEVPTDIWNLIVGYGLHKEMLLVNRYLNRIVQPRLRKDKIFGGKVSSPDHWLWIDNPYQWMVWEIEESHQTVVFRNGQFVWEGTATGRTPHGRTIYSRTRSRQGYSVYFRDGSLCERKLGRLVTRYRRDGSKRWEFTIGDFQKLHYDSRGSRVHHYNYVRTLKEAPCISD